MTVAVLSDIHDNIWNLERVLKRVNGVKPGALLFLGDFCAPFTLAQLAEGFSGPVHVVFGNNDGDTFLISRTAAKYSHVTLYGQFAEIEIDGKRIALNHYPDISSAVAASGRYDAVFSGHDHKRYVETNGRTIRANPGEIMGRFGTVSFGVYDTTSHSFEHIIISSDD